MLFLDVIATPFYLMYGIAAFLIAFGIFTLVVLTLMLFALFQRFLGKDEKKKDENDEDPQP